MKENRLKELLRIRSLSELPVFGKLLVVAFSFFFGVFVRTVGSIRKNSNGGEKTK